MYETSLSKGQELVAQRMVREFNRLGHVAYLITSGYHDWELFIPEDEIAKRGGYAHVFDQRLGIPIIRVGSEAASWPPRRILFRNFVGTLTQIVADLKLNVLITHSTLWNGPEDTAKFVVWNRNMARQGANNPPVLFCHMSHFQEASDERYTVEERTFRETWNKVSLQEILRQADFVLVTTPLEKEQMKKLGASEDKFVLFPGGIDEEIFWEMSGEILERMGISGETKLVTFLGTVEQRKNVLSVIEVAKAFVENNGVHFVIAGRMEGEYADQVRAAAQGLGNVSLLGEVTDGEKAQLIDLSFANILLSRSEALGITQLEFMYRGVPVITSGAGGQSWIVRDGDNGVVLKGPDDIDGARTAINLMLSDPSFRMRISEGARRTSSQATLSNLVAGLSKKLMDRLSKVPGATELQEAKEKLVEASVKGSRKVAVTTKRLIMSSTKSNRQVTSVPYAEITGVHMRERRRWLVLLVGVVLSAIVLCTLLLLPRQLGGAFSSLGVTPVIGGSNVQDNAFGIGISLVPLVIAMAVFFKKVEEGFVVYYGKAQKVFLEREFGKALRIAQSLSENRLFSMAMEELDVSQA
jgi:glycosyltransferase involved in cell wall biosynthesis